MEQNNEKQQREVFVWKQAHEKCLIAELLLVEPYLHKPNSKERGLAWKQVAQNLNNLQEPEFHVTGRAIRDKFKRLLENFNKIEASEAKASGIVGHEEDEIYRGLRDIKERMAEADMVLGEDLENKRVKDADDQRKAEDARRKATERLGETIKRKEQEEGAETQRRKRKSTEAMALLEQGLQMKQKNLELQEKLRREELEEKRLDRDQRRQEMQQQQQFLSNLQEQQQQFLLQMQQNQLQSLTLMKEMFQSFMGKKD